MGKAGFCILFLFFFAFILPEALASDKPRIVVLTDMGEDPDDQQSLVRFLLYACNYDVEGIIATTSEWMRGNDENHPVNPAPEYIYEILEAYNQVEDNLRTHAKKYPAAAYYPTTDHLRSMVFDGNVDHGENQVFGMDDVGEGKSSGGSDHIINVLKKQDNRPVWVLVWGGANTLAQAVYDISNDSSLDSLKKEQLFAKLRVYDIAGQDDAGGWIAYHYPQIFYMRSMVQFRGMAYHSCYEYSKESFIYRSDDCPPEQYCCRITDEQGGNPDIFTPGWISTYIKMEDHPLGNVYPRRGSSWSEGQSPTFLYLVNDGLSFPDSIAWGGWGGRFQREKACSDVISDERHLINLDFKKDYCMFIPARDWAYTPRVDTYTWNRLAPVFRFREEMSNDFRARMQWAIKSVDSTNHAPTISIEGYNTGKPFYVKILPDEQAIFDASSSSDPEGDSLKYHWWIYEEPGFYSGKVDLEKSIGNQHSSSASVQVPSDAKPGDRIHIILELMDEGQPNLITYQRIVLQVK